MFTFILGPPKTTVERLYLVVQACILPFEQFLEKGTVCLQDNISKKLHKHSFSIIILNVSLILIVFASNPT
jgi:hypothetical protein